MSLEATTTMCQNKLIPWQWAPPGCGKAGYSTEVMRLFNTECITCEHYQGTRPSCKYVNDLYNGTYPKGPPPAVWFTTEDGQVVCTGKKILTPQEVPANLNVLRNPKETPAAPAPDLPEVPPVLYHAESDCLVYVDTVEEAEEMLNTGLVDPAGKARIVEILYKTIFKGPR